MRVMDHDQINAKKHVADELGRALAHIEQAARSLGYRLEPANGNGNGCTCAPTVLTDIVTSTGQPVSMAETPAAPQRVATAETTREAPLPVRRPDNRPERVSQNAWADRRPTVEADTSQPELRIGKAKRRVT